MLLVAVAAGVGAVVRLQLSGLMRPDGFPWATLAINLSGSLLLGALIGLSLRRPLHPLALPVLGAGLLGGFTTFSAFSVEALQMLRGDRQGSAAAYLVLSVLGGLLAAAVGFVTTRP